LRPSWTHQSTIYPEAAIIELPTSITDAAQRLRNGSLTCEALSAAYLRSMERLQPHLNAMITVTAERAIDEARRLDAELRGGTDRGPLHGIPIVHKDNLSVAGVPATVGSAYFRQRVPDQDAAIVRRLRDAGAVSLGKTNMSEFASGSSGVNVFFGNVHNPWDVTRAPGGSSSGTAAAVAAGMCLAGTGTDSGGSIRQPAARCGVVGIRPTFGRVSLAGVWPRTRTLGAGGPITRTVHDAAIMLNAMAGYDANYASSLKTAPEDFTAALDDGMAGLRIAVIDDYTFKGVDDEVAVAIRRAVDVMARLGAKVSTIQVPALTGALDYAGLFANVLLYEFNDILGAQYRAEPDREKLFGPMVKSDLERGSRIERATYERILADRPGQVRQVKSAFESVDALITPTLPNVAPLQTEGPAVWARGRQFNLPFSFAGVPSISVPCGVSSTGLPIGLQIVANELRESQLLRIAASYEAATDFHLQHPPLYCADA
jgi:aspartyl-tRNA(Asn)/glutamyl-tRNA(Gln) amidotransferase subunit A